jgi:hypothetical protein
MYISDEAMSAWWWTIESTDPYIYRFSDGVWLGYQEGSSGPRRFNNLGTGAWESR